MKISENWLRELVTLDADRAALIEKLNMIGHEVEEAVPLGEGLAGVVVAQIVECAKHPEADRLQVCKVDAGGGTMLQIVCGAPNARPGLKAPLAMVGAKVGEITIKAAKLRGVESTGMLCSAKELGIDADASGLLELSADAPVGKPLADYLGLPDCTIDLGLTPNRADCLSLHGVANDVAAAFGVVHKLPVLAPIDASISREIKINLEAPADCPRFCGRYIEGIDPNAKAPLWLTERLRRCGLRSISLLVDVTNYVMIELGQPLHAFDAATLAGPIGVRFARAGEQLKLLDEREVTLSEKFLIVTDADKAASLGGIMGGFDTRVTATTRDVFLEAAHWRPSVIAGRARSLGLHTDAAHRFERGVDAALPRRALERATQLIVEFGGGKPGAVIEAVSPEHLPRRAPIALRRARIARVLGIEVPDSKVERILGALNLKLEKTAEGWRATPPSARFDLALEVDLIEEIARIHGYERIPTVAPRGELDVPVLAEDRVDVAALRSQLAARDYFEAITYAFVHADALRMWQLDEGAIALANPLSADLGVMRTSLLPGLAAALSTNRNRQQERVRLFEVGNVFRANVQPGAAPVETLRIAGVACGHAAELQWGVDKRALDFHDIKGDVESLFALSAAAGEFRFESTKIACLHPGRAAQVKRGGAVIGHIGALHPSLAKALDLDTDVYMFEFDVTPLAARHVPRSQPIARFPSLRRDLSFELPESVSYLTVETAVRAAVGASLREIFVFDRYAGHNLGTGLKSLAIGLILQDDYRTLTDGDADTSVALAVAALEQHCQARLRG